MSVRLDIRLTELGICDSRTKAQELIKNGAVNVNGVTASKPSYPTCETDTVTVNKDTVCPYVSRGGLKLEAALEGFQIDVKGSVCIDIGASTGGFTDCLLQRGAKKVYAVDSGSSQLHPSLRSDSRVVSMENTNARYIKESDLPEKADIIVMDVSFISQTKLYPALTAILSDNGLLISLIKPQFEVGREGIGKGGIVKDQKLRDKAVVGVLEVARSYGLICEGKMMSPIKGGDGNTEYLAVFRLNKLNY